MTFALWMATAALMSPPADSSFKAFHEADGVKVEMARAQAETPWIRGTCVLPGDAEELAGLLRNYENYAKIFAPHVGKVTVLDKQESAAKLHVVWPLPFPYDDRDGWVNYQSETKADGEFRLSWQEAAPSQDDKKSVGVRIEKIAGETRVQALGKGSSKVTYTYFGELGGDFMDWIKEKAWKEEPLAYCKALKDALAQKSP